MLIDVVEFCKKGELDCDEIRPSVKNKLRYYNDSEDLVFGIRFFNNKKIVILVDRFANNGWMRWGCERKDKLS